MGGVDLVSLNNRFRFLSHGRGSLMSMGVVGMCGEVGGLGV